tara:strand:+ start:56 stop:325 length:270 start_codon:yes stop_codon:yes gene_type:complete
MDVNTKELLSKKLMIGAYLGQTVVCDRDIDIYRGMSHGIQGAAFLVTGIVGVIKQGVITGFDVIIDGVSNGESLTITAEVFSENFTLVR